MTAFVELCAGMVGVSMRLARRNVLLKYRGGKYRLAPDIIDVGVIKRPSRYIWAEANPHARRFLQTFSDPDVADGAVKIIQSWVDEGPYAVKNRWVELAKLFDAKSFRSLDVSDEEHCASFFLWRQIEGMHRAPAVYLLGLALAEGAQKNDEIKRHDWIFYQAQACAKNFSGMKATIYDDAASVKPFKNAVVYLDPPYAGTRGYSQFDLPREQVVEIAKDWDRAGAQVIVSEGSPVEELVLEGWHTCRISDRTGFQPGVCSPEHLTTNRVPYGELGRGGITALFAEE